MLIWAGSGGPRTRPPAAALPARQCRAFLRGFWCFGSLLPKPYLAPGVQRGQRPLFGFRRDDNPGATYRPAPVATRPQHPPASDKTTACPAPHRGSSPAVSGRGEGRESRGEGVPSLSKRIHRNAMLISEGGGGRAPHKPSCPARQCRVTPLCPPGVQGNRSRRSEPDAV